MNWKKIKIGLLIILGLIIIIPAILYISAVDWSKQHSTRLEQLSVFDSAVGAGEYRLNANGLEFLVRVKGMQNDGPAMILLHGFPESSLMWQSLLDTAAAKGYRVLAFDQRGYSPNARPIGVDNYQLDSLVQDVLAIADQVGFDTFHLVGHDWGAAVAWKTTMDFPARIHSLTAMSVPHLDVFFKSILNHDEQKKRSSYIQTLRKPYLPEFIFQVGMNRIAKKQKGIWTDDQIQEYQSIQREYGAISSMLNWYRAVDLDAVISDDTFNKKITRPTLFIWGKNDPYIAPSIIPMQKSYIDAPYRTLELDTEHALMQSKTKSILAAIFASIQ